MLLLLFVWNSNCQLLWKCGQIRLRDEFGDGMQLEDLVVR